MKQFNFINFGKLWRSALVLTLLACATFGSQSRAIAQLLDATPLAKPVSVDGHNDLVITASQIRMINPVNLWKVIMFYDPSISNTNEQLYGSDPTVPSHDMTIRGSKRWAVDEAIKATQPLYIVDGAIVDGRIFFDVDINDVDRVIIRKDPVSLARYGVRGADGVLEIITKKPIKGPLKIRYAFDAVVESADLSSYNLMNAPQFVQFQQASGVFGKVPESFAKIKSDVAAGLNTNWLREPLRTAFSHRHKISIEGGDSSVKYSISARFAPSGQGVLDGTQKNMSGIAAYVEYRYRNLKISNHMSYDKITNEKTSNFMTPFSDFAYQSPYLSPTNAQGGVDKAIGYDDIALYTNLKYENSLGSFDRTHTYSIYDNLNLSLDLGAGFSANGRFSFVKDLVRNDLYFSPNSNRYTLNDVAGTTGFYGIMRNNRQSFEGAADVTYHKVVGKSIFGAMLAGEIYNGKFSEESYSGTGIISDKMNYISFTKEYNSGLPPFAARFYDRTMNGSLSAYYSYDDRYTIHGVLHADKSSLLSPDKKEAMFYGVSAAWNVHNEKFAKDNSWFDRLTVSAAMGTSGTMDAASSDFLVSYRSSIGNEYIYNYYLIGSAITGMPNPNLKWRTLLSRTLSLDAKFKNGILLRLNYYNNQSKDLLVVEQLPHSTGEKHILSNGGKIRNAGLDYYVSATLLSRTDMRLGVFTAGNINRNSIVDVPDYFTGVYNSEMMDVPFNASLSHLKKGESVNALYGYGSTINNGKETVDDNYVYVASADAKLKGNFGVNFDYKGWDMTVACNFRLGGSVYNQTLYDIQNLSNQFNNDVRAMDPAYRTESDEDDRPLGRFVERFNEFTLGTVQLGYTFPIQKISKVYLRNLSVFVTGNNLLYTSSVDMQRGLYYPFARTFSLSLRATF